MDKPDQCAPSTWWARTACVRSTSFCCRSSLKRQAPYNEGQEDFLKTILRPAPSSATS